MSRPSLTRRWCRKRGRIQSEWLLGFNSVFKGEMPIITVYFNKLLYAKNISSTRPFIELPSICLNVMIMNGRLSGEMLTGTGITSLAFAFAVNQRTARKRDREREREGWLIE